MEGLHETVSSGLERLEKTYRLIIIHLHIDKERQG